MDEFTYNLERCIIENKDKVKRDLEKIYVMKCEQYYKIGYAKDPQKRLKAIQTSNPHLVSLVLVVHPFDAIRIEGELLSRFHSKRVKGEWFTLDSEDVAYIATRFSSDSYETVDGMVKTFKEEHKNMEDAQDAKLKQLINN